MAEDKGACVHCGNTGIHVETRFKDDEILRDRAGKVLLPWEIRALSPEQRRAMVTKGEVTVKPIAIAYQVADPTRNCKLCDAGRDREHRELANTPPIKPTRTRKNREDERDAS